MSEKENSQSTSPRSPLRQREQVNAHDALLRPRGGTKERRVLFPPAPPPPTVCCATNNDGSDLLRRFNDSLLELSPSAIDVAAMQLHQLQPQRPLPNNYSASSEAKSRSSSSSMTTANDLLAEATAEEMLADAALAERDFVGAIEMFEASVRHANEAVVAAAALSRRTCDVGESVRASLPLLKKCREFAARVELRAAETRCARLDALVGAPSTAPSAIRPSQPLCYETFLPRPSVTVPPSAPFVSQLRCSRCGEHPAHIDGPRAIAAMKFCQWCGLRANFM